MQNPTVPSSDDKNKANNNKKTTAQPITALPDSDQDAHTLGIRDLKERDSEDGKYNEEEQAAINNRRDQEESLYNEAGQLPSEQSST